MTIKWIFSKLKARKFPSFLSLLSLYFECRREGASSSLNIFKYKKYNPAGGYGYKLLPYVRYIKASTNITVKNVFEIGANFAQDADFLMECFGLSPKDVYVFEAHPEIFAAIKKIHRFNCTEAAVCNEEGEITFNVYPINYENTGCSSIRGVGGGGGTGAFYC